MKINTTVGNVNIKLNTDRFDKHFNKAQIRLNTLVVADSTPYIPFSQGQLRSQVDFPHGISGDEVRWYAPYAHYQYKGELYLTANGSSYAQSGEVKYPTGRPLNYHNGGGAEWFEEAKKVHKSEWIREVRRIGGGG